MKKFLLQVDNKLRLNEWKRDRIEKKREKYRRHRQFQNKMCISSKEQKLRRSGQRGIEGDAWTGFLSEVLPGVEVNTKHRTKKLYIL